MLSNLFNVIYLRGDAWSLYRKVVFTFTLFAMLVLAYSKYIFASVWIAAALSVLGAVYNFTSDKTCTHDKWIYYLHAAMILLFLLNYAYAYHLLVTSAR